MKRLDALRVSDTATAMQKAIFQLSGSCQFTNVVSQNKQGQYVLATKADKGNVTGLWQWQFSHGFTGKTNIEGRTTISGDSQKHLSGIIKIPMFGMREQKSVTQLLFVSFESSTISMDDANHTMIVIDGHFQGGTGEYKNVKGSVTLLSVNGLIQQGSGALLY